MQHSPKTLIVAQLIISFCMALSMIAIATFSNLGFTTEAVHEWLHRFILAWPIAFVLANIVSRIAFPLAIRLTVQESNIDNEPEIEGEIS